MGSFYSLDVTILILIDGFLQCVEDVVKEKNRRVTILILIDGFLQFERKIGDAVFNTVTILILIDGFLQFDFLVSLHHIEDCHNPYFNRWFSAMWRISLRPENCTMSHNPYFNRWFSAITEVIDAVFNCPLVTILILIDGFLQCKDNCIPTRKIQ